MLFANRHQWIRKLILIIFLLIFAVVVYYLSQLRLYIDDYVFEYGQPSLIHNFATFFASYTHEAGLYRPLAVIYYFFIYFLYSVSPIVAHIIPFGIHVITGYLLYCVLIKQGLEYTLAFLAGLFYVLHPFATEQYMWLSANPGTLVNFLFVVQLWIVEKENNRNHLILWIVVLSLLSIFIYESTFFFFIPLTYAIVKKMSLYHKVSRMQTVKIILYFLLPISLYVGTKIFFVPNNPRPLVDSIGLVIRHGVDLFNTMTAVYFGDYYVSNFWHVYTTYGWSIISQNYVSTGVLSIFIIGYALCMFSFKRKEIISPKKQVLFFWLLVVISSLLPLLANKYFYFGFRSLFLPSVAIGVALLWVCQMVLGRSSLFLLKIAGGYTVVIFVLMTISITTHYIQQSKEDMILVNKIDSIIKTSNFPRASNSLVIIMKSNVSFDSRETFLHADHVLSCFFYEWSIIPCMQTVTDQIGAFAIEHIDGRVTVQRGYTLETLMQQRPLLVLRYTTDKQIVVENIVY